MKEMITKKIEEAIKAIKQDPKMLVQFKNEPVKVIEKLVGMDLPDEIVLAVIDGIKKGLADDDKKDDGKLDMDDVKKAANLLKKLF